MMTVAMMVTVVVVVRLVVKDLLGSEDWPAAHTTNPYILKNITRTLLTYTRLFALSHRIPVPMPVHSVFPQQLYASGSPPALEASPP